MPDFHSSSSSHIRSTEQRDLRAPLSLSMGRGTAAGLLRTLAFIVLDAISLSLAWKTALWLTDRAEGSPRLLSIELFQSLPPILIITIVTLLAAGLYNERESRRNFLRLLRSLALVQVMLAAIAFLDRSAPFASVPQFLEIWSASLGGLALFSLLFVPLGRWMAESTITMLRRRGTVTRPIFLIGTWRDRWVTRIALKLSSNREFKIVGQLNLWEEVGLNLSNPDICYHWQHLIRHIADRGVGEVFVCTWPLIQNPKDDIDLYWSLMELYWSLKLEGIHLRILPVSLDVPHQAPVMEMIGDLLTIQFHPPALVGYDFWTKRLFDIAVASLILLLGSPIYLLLALAIKLDSPGPIFFKQTRVGLKGKYIKVWKFRTMVANADQLMKELEASNEIKGGVLFKMKEDPRITKVGKFLRRYSLDELPQAINVLIGEMSLVGPRPLPLRDVENFAPRHHFRHNVMPGITGLWQVSGRSDIKDFEDAFRLDMSYVENWSLGLDFQILLKTIQVVLGSKGAY
ncbi:MAG: sugar transferase [Cyanobacteriota bacterium]|nr:sugar transferase [Cyanobacteriota bacterium]